MKNATGLSRSKEFLKANPGQAPKVHHLRLTPHAEGVKVTHHASAEAPPHATHQFGMDEGPELAEHIGKHTGVDMENAEPEMEPETPGAAEEEE